MLTTILNEQNLLNNIKDVETKLNICTDKILYIKKCGKLDFYK